MIRTETELVLKSRWVRPGKLEDAGFTWQHPELEGALADIAGRRGVQKGSVGSL